MVTEPRRKVVIATKVWGQVLSDAASGPQRVEGQDSGAVDQPGTCPSWLRRAAFLTSSDRLITIFQAPGKENCDFLGGVIARQQR